MAGSHPAPQILQQKPPFQSLPAHHGLLHFRTDRRSVRRKSSVQKLRCAPVQCLPGADRRREIPGQIHRLKINLPVSLLLYVFLPLPDAFLNLLPDAVRGRFRFLFSVRRRCPGKCFTVRIFRLPLLFPTAQPVQTDSRQGRVPVQLPHPDSHRQRSGFSGTCFRIRN